VQSAASFWSERVSEQASDATSGLPHRAQLPKNLLLSFCSTVERGESLAAAATAAAAAAPTPSRPMHSASAGALHTNCYLFLLITEQKMQLIRFGIYLKCS